MDVLTCPESTVDCSPVPIPAEFYISIILKFRPRNEQTTFFQIVNEVSRLETQPLGGHPNPLLPSIQDDIMYGKPNIEPPSYDLPPPSYDEVMKSNKI